MNSFKPTLISACLCMIALPAVAWSPAGDNIKTKWTYELNPDLALQEYPRPQMVREEWKCLNGIWEYAIAKTDEKKMPKAEGEILVPFAIESSLSGVGKVLEADEALWYFRKFSIPAEWKGKQILLHFGAVDWKYTLWINGQQVAEHKGGYTESTVDITDCLKKGKQQKLVMKVTDGTDNDLQPRGKQVRKPDGIWYTPVTGIWQTVWMEPVNPEGFISNYKVVSDIDKGTVTFTPSVTSGDCNLSVELTFNGVKVADASGPAGKSITVKVDNPKLWTPDTPNLYDFKMTLTRDGSALDIVTGYTSMRKISVIRDALGNKRMALNNEILFQFGPLDQGWWPDGLYTAPCDEALRYDIEMTKKMGFNMIRKHIKVEPARWYMWCDRLGMLVWQDMPSISGYCGGVWSQKVKNGNGENDYDLGSDSILSDEAKANYRNEWTEIINQLDKFQCIVVWVPFNECWAQFETGKIVEYTRFLDPTRLINGASGGNWVRGQMGDILDTHHYPNPKMRIIDKDLVNVLGEYGGIGMPIRDHIWQTGRKWGYIEFKTKDEVTAKYLEYIRDLHDIVTKGCAAAVYTQTTDVEGEVNGLMTYDRKINKVDMKQICKANQAIIKAGNEICTIYEKDFLEGYDPAEYSLITLRSGKLTMQVTNFGGRVVNLWVPDRNGKYADVVIGYNTLDQYVNNKGERFLGASPGPVANRIGKAEFKLGKTKFKLSANDGVNTLHGGFKGIDMLVWKVVSQSENSVTFEVEHPDGLDGFPGNKIIRMTYTLTEEGEFKVDFEATTDKDTPINLAHHSFFNLRGCGNGTILDHVLTIKASANTPVNEQLIPTGEIVSLADTPRDFRKPHAIGERIDDYSDVQMAYGHGYDHNYVLDRKDNGKMELAATVYEPESGRYMEVLTDQIALQFYSGYFFDGSSKDKYGNTLGRNCSLALETQKFPDSVNHANFPSIILKAGDTYRHSCVYKFSVK